MDLAIDRPENVQIQQGMDACRGTLTDAGEHDAVPVTFQEGSLVGQDVTNALDALPQTNGLKFFSFGKVLYVPDVKPLVDPVEGECFVGGHRRVGKHPSE